jgi:YidC/Oxa1 family membrane protein insertase
MLIAVVLSAGFFLLWYTVLNPQKDVPERAISQPAQEQTTAAAQAVDDAASEPLSAKTKTGAAIAVYDPQKGLPLKTWTISNDLVEVEFTTDGGVPNYWRTKNYTKTVDAGSPPIDLVIEGAVVPLTLAFENADFSFPERPRYELIEADESRVLFKWRSDDVEVLKEISLKPGSYQADISVSVKNVGGKEALRASPTLKWGGLHLPFKGGGLLGFMKQPPIESMTPVYFLDGKAIREAKVLELGRQNETAGAVYWAGVESRYFISVIVPRQQGDGLSAGYGATRTSDMPEGQMAVWGGVSLPKIVIPSGDTENAVFSAYAGPKDLENLKAVGVNLDKAIDYGWFTIIAIPILYLLHFFYSIINNYGVAIVLLTIFVKLLLHPINVKSLKSMKAMQQLQPRLKEFQAKYKDDKQKLNAETMQLFKAHKVNPMGGCLPMLAQFPIYIALYKVLWNSIELFHQPFFWFYKDLSAPDPYYITPILLGLFMAAQQKLTPSASADPTQQKMMMIMPVMFTVFMLFLPLGLVVYILVNTVMSVTQQYMYNHGIGIMDLVRGRWKAAHRKA